MSEQLTRETVNELMKIDVPVCLSLYMPTNRTFPQRNKNPIVFKNLVTQLKEQLVLQRPDADHDELLRPFEQLLDDTDFWQHPQNGLAIIAGNGFFNLYHLAQPVPAGTFICNHPYLTPLIRITQAAGNYQILCLSRDNIRLFEGNRDIIHEVSLHPDVPRTKEHALGYELTPSDQTGFTQGFSAAGERGYTYAHESGGGGKQAEIDIDRERYFRAVDKALLQQHSRPSGLPLILAGLPENQAFFREVSHNPYLQASGVNVDLSELDTEKLRKQCWQLMSSLYNEKIDDILQQYNQSCSHGLASSELGEIEHAAECGRVATLLVEDDRLKVDAVNNNQSAEELAASYRQQTTQNRADNYADPLEELAFKVMQNGGDVYVVPPKYIPNQTGAAAVYRF